MDRTYYHNVFVFECGVDRKDWEMEADEYWDLRQAQDEIPCVYRFYKNRHSCVLLWSNQMLSVDADGTVDFENEPGFDDSDECFI